MPASAPRHVRRPSRQHGQALAFATVTVAVVMLAMLVMVSSGQLATEKTRLQNTGDAAAYSGALVLSRDYNFSAYTNRAMVANQVAVAQMVGMTSWARHNDEVFNGLLGAWLPCAVAMIGEFSATAIEFCADKWPTMGRAASAYKTEVQDMAGASIPALDDLMGALQDGQVLYHEGTLALVASTVPDVIKANDPAATFNLASVANLAFMARFGDQFKNFTRTYQGTADLQRFADVTHRSLDIFSGSSDIVQRVGPVPFDAFTDNSSESLRDVDVIGGGTMQMWNVHTGGTELTADFKSWNALDVSTMYFHQQWWDSCNSWFFGIPQCFGHNFGELSTAWGGAYAGQHAPGFDSVYGNDNYLRNWQSYGNSLLENFLPTNIQLGVGASSAGKYSGLRPYQELGNVGADAGTRMKNVDSTLAGSYVPLIVIDVEKKTANILTAANMPQSVNGEIGLGAKKVQLKVPDKAGGVLQVIAGAEVYFARPEARADGKVEWPSLFNPYWQARLRDTHLDVAAALLVP